MATRARKAKSKIKTRPRALKRIIGPFIILGFDTEVVYIENQDSGETVGQQDVEIQIPPDTRHVLCSISGFVLSFGERKADKETYEVGGHLMGLDYGQAWVSEVNPPTAILTSRMLRRDDNGNDRWTGTLAVNLIFLGDHP